MTLSLINLQKKLIEKNATVKNGPLQSSTQMKKNLQKSTDTISLQVKSPLENKKSHQYGETGYYLISILGKEDFVLDFIKNQKSLKALKSTENISAYKDILARIEVKLFCKEEVLQLQLRDKEIKNLKQNKDGSIISTELENCNYKKTLQQLK